MKIEDFFSFDSKYISSTFQAEIIELESNSFEKKTHLNLIKGDYEEINFPIVFRQESGKILSDILDTGHVGFFLISEKLKNILEENNFTGWKTFPIKLYDKSGKEITGYYGFSITGKCGPINYEMSEIIEKRRIPTAPPRKFYKGLNIGLEKWDGTDFFTPPDNFRTIITKRAANVLKKKKVTNLNLKT